MHSRKYFYKKIDTANIHPQQTGKSSTLVILTDDVNRTSQFFSPLLPDLIQEYNVLFYLQPSARLKQAGKRTAIQDIRDIFVSFFKAAAIKKYNPPFVILDMAASAPLAFALYKTGIASLFLLNARLHKQCHNLKRTVKYATRIVLLDHAGAEDPVLSEFLQGRLPENITTGPDTGRQLITLGKTAARQLQQEQRDTACLVQSSDFDYTYWTGKRGKLTKRQAGTYIRSWKNRVYPKHPCPGFHPGIYAAHTNLGTEKIDAFAHYLQAGKPQGAWSWEVISKAVPVSDDVLQQKIALHIHAYYPDMLADMITRLSANKVRPDLFISVSTAENQAFAENLLHTYSGRVTIRTVPNRGRDIGPLLTEFGTLLTENYQFIGHIHTKKSLLRKKRKKGILWYQFLMHNLLGDGGKITAADTILQKMHENPEIGLVFPDDKRTAMWDKNYVPASRLASQLGIEVSPLFSHFPAGTMFWIRPTLLKPFIDLQLGWDDYPAEPLELDGTDLHAIERLFGEIPQKFGKTIACTYFDGMQH